jgi:hypothetical protein
VAAEPDKREPEAPIPDLGQVLTGLSNAELLATLDLVLVELERRLLRYAQVGPEILEMADEGLVLAARSGARLGQAQSSAAHTHGHLQLVGVGSWSPQRTAPSWSDDPRLFPEPDDDPEKGG